MVFQSKAVSNPQGSFWLSSTSQACGGCSRLILHEDQHMAIAAGSAGAPLSAGRILPLREEKVLPGLFHPLAAGTSFESLLLCCV